jgi:NADPH-dependent curcumin reductase CurA
LRDAVLQAAGNTVVATCGSEEKAALLRRLGADRVINYRKEDLKAVLRAEYPKACALSFRSQSSRCLAVPHVAVECMGACSRCPFPLFKAGCRY